jgi:membrane protein implicated in regulation of membrane protease activity
MTEFWNSLELFEKILWGTAIGSSFVFIIQSVMTFTGMDAHDGAGAEFDGSESDPSPFQLFSFRNLINFLLGFSWAGISLSSFVESKALIAFFATVGGLLLVTVVMLIFYYMSRLGQSGNISPIEAVGKTGVVYVPITGHRARAGKIQLALRGAMREFDALTEGDTLKTGEPVVVQSVIEGNLLLVKKI